MQAVGDVGACSYIAIWRSIHAISRRKAAVRDYTCCVTVRRQRRQIQRRQNRATTTALFAVERDRPTAAVRPLTVNLAVDGRKTAFGRQRRLEMIGSVTSWPRLSSETTGQLDVVLHRQRTPSPTPCMRLTHAVRQNSWQCCENTSLNTSATIIFMRQMQIVASNLHHKSSSLVAGVKVGVFACVGWQVKLCDPVMQVVPRMGSPIHDITVC